MAGDYDSSLPVYTRADGDVSSVIVDHSTKTNGWDITAAGCGKVQVCGIDAGSKIIVTDGTDDLDVVGDGDTCTNGIVAFGCGPSGAKALQMN